MKKWPLVVAALYGAILLLLFVPAVWAAFGFGAMNPIKTFWDVLVTWQTWPIVTVLILAQFVLLRVPVDMANRRPQRKRSLLSTVIAAALMMGLLVFGAVVSSWEFINKYVKTPDSVPVMWISIGVGLASWAGWASYFYRVTKSSAPEMQMGQLRRYLWKGSILELLVALPTHIVVRQRSDCCAGMMTFIGLTCGISVMLFAFGPAVYFLFVERWKRLHPNA
jgi:hypothetical protein